jgi:hypothetical protein
MGSQTIKKVMQMNLNRVSKIQNNKDYDGWNFTMDGMYKKPRVKKADKKRRQRQRRRIIKRMST